MKKMMLLVLALSLATILAACGDDSASEKSNDKKTEKTEEAAQTVKVKVTDKEKVDKEKVVVDINGKKIKGTTYNTMYTLNKIAMSQYGQDVSDTEKIKKDTLQILVKQELLNQEAKELGIKVTEKEVASKFKSIKSQNGKQFSDILKKYNISEGAYKDQLSYGLLQQKFIKEEIKAGKVTDKEVQAFYDKLKEQSKSKEVPKLKDVKEQIKTKLQQQKEKQQLQTKVEQLKKNAEIKHMI